MKWLIVAGLVGAGVYAWRRFDRPCCQDAGLPEGDIFKDRDRINGSEMEELFSTGRKSELDGFTSLESARRLIKSEGCAA